MVAELKSLEAVPQRPNMPMLALLRRTRLIHWPMLTPQHLRQPRPLSQRAQGASGSIWEHLGAYVLTTRPGIIATFLHRQLRENALQTELRSRSLFQTYLLCIEAYEVHPRQAQPSMLKCIRHSMPKQCSAVADPERAEVEKTSGVLTASGTARFGDAPARPRQNAAQAGRALFQL